jgi:hypothetical protein
MYNYYNDLQPCALNAEFQHFMPRLNKTSVLCGSHSMWWSGVKRRPKTGWRQDDFKENSTDCKCFASSRATWNEMKWWSCCVWKEMMVVLWHNIHAWPTQHPPVQHPKNPVLGFHGWDETLPQGSDYLVSSFFIKIFWAFFFFFFLRLFFWGELTVFFPRLPFD